MHLLSEFRPDELAQILVSGEPFWLDLGNEAAAVPEPLMEVLDLGAPPEGVAAGVPSAPTAHSEFIALTLAAVGADGASSRSRCCSPTAS